MTVTPLFYREYFRLYCFKTYCSSTLDIAIICNFHLFHKVNERIKLFKPPTAQSITSIGLDLLESMPSSTYLRAIILKVYSLFANDYMITD